MVQRGINRIVIGMRARPPAVEEIDHLARRWLAVDSDGSSVTRSAAISISG
jgi:hypothetical protein